MPKSTRKGARTKPARRGIVTVTIDLDELKKLYADTYGPGRADGGDGDTKGGARRRRRDGGDGDTKGGRRAPRRRDGGDGDTKGGATRRPARRKSPTKKR